MYDTDVIGANNAGIKSAWLNKKGAADPEKLATYDKASLEELAEII